MLLIPDSRATWPTPCQDPSELDTKGVRNKDAIAELRNSPSLNKLVRYIDCKPVLRLLYQTHCRT